MQLISVSQFILEAMDVVARLDTVGLRDDRETTLAILQRAEEDYASLVKRRDALPMAPEDEAVIDPLMDNLRARLKFFQKRL